MNNEFNTQPKPSALNQFCEYNADQQQQENTKNKEPNNLNGSTEIPMTGNSNNGDCATDILWLVMI